MSRVKRVISRPPHILRFKGATSIKGIHKDMVSLIAICNFDRPFRSSLQYHPESAFPLSGIHHIADHVSSNEP